MADWTTPSAVHSKCGEDTGHEAVLAIDENIATYWIHSPLVTHWIIFDMGETKKITKIRVYQVLHYPFGGNANVNVYVGDDPANLGDAVWTGNLGASTGWYESGAFEKNGRYVKLATTSNASEQRMYEFDAYAEAVGGVLKEVTDSLSLSDAVLRDKTLTISDSVGALDSLLANKTLQIADTISILETVLRDKTFTVSDSIGLSELVTVITGGILKEVLDTIGLSEQVKIDKSLIIQDAASILDQIFRHKPQVTITDAVALAEIIAVSKLLAITDSVSIADVVYAMKTLPIYDQITVTDQIATPSRILQALDAIGLSDTSYVNKTLIITDQIALAEVVEVGKGGVAKTKLFLIFGNIAIQIQG
jgi:hypothetical protein